MQSVSLGFPYGSRLGATYTLNYKKYPDFSQVVHDLTGGVDLILDPIGA